MDPHNTGGLTVSPAFFMAELSEHYRCKWARYDDDFLGLYCMGGEL